MGTCDRPKALNALNFSMTETLHKLYRVRLPLCRKPSMLLQAMRLCLTCCVRFFMQDWEANANVQCIILKGAGEKAFCAGGDVKGMVQHILAGEQDKAVRQALDSQCTGHAFATHTNSCCAGLVFAKTSGAC